MVANSCDLRNLDPLHRCALPSPSLPSIPLPPSAAGVSSAVEGNEKERRGSSAGRPSTMSGDCVCRCVLCVCVRECVENGVGARCVWEVHSWCYQTVCFTSDETPMNREIQGEGNVYRGRV